MGPDVKLYWFNMFDATALFEIYIFTPEGGLLEAVAVTIGAVLYAGTCEFLYPDPLVILTLTTCPAAPSTAVPVAAVVQVVESEFVNVMFGSVAVVYPDPPFVTVTDRTFVPNGSGCVPSDVIVAESCAAVVPSRDVLLVQP